MRIHYATEWNGTQLVRFNHDGRPGPMQIHRGGGDCLREIQTFLKSCNAWLREDISFEGEIEFIRQGTPPDESYAKAQEELAETVSHASRRAEIQAWELIRNDGQLAREAGAKQNPSGSAFVP